MNIPRIILQADLAAPEPARTGWIYGLIALLCVGGLLYLAQKQGYVRLPKQLAGIPISRGDYHDAGPDAGAPRERAIPPMTRDDGPAIDGDTILRRWRQAPEFLISHIQDFLDQPDGLDEFRAATEAVEFEHNTEDEPEDKRKKRDQPPGGQRVKILAVTAETFALIPPEVARNMFSTRSRPMLELVTTKPEERADNTPRPAGGRLVRTNGRLKLDHINPEESS